MALTLVALSGLALLVVDLCNLFSTTIVLRSGAPKSVRPRVLRCTVHPGGMVMVLRPWSSKVFSGPNLPWGQLAMAISECVGGKLITALFCRRPKMLGSGEELSRKHFWIVTLKNWAGPHGRLSMSNCWVCLGQIPLSQCSGFFMEITLSMF